MRTAITLGQKHDNSWEVIHLPSVSVVEQLEYWRKSLGNAVNKTYKKITYQESDGIAAEMSFRTEAQQIAFADKRNAETIAKELKSAQKRIEPINRKQEFVRK
jgi:hypothetical protein